MKTSLRQGSSDHLTKHEARAFKQRWEGVNAAEREDLAQPRWLKNFASWRR